MTRPSKAILLATLASAVAAANKTLIEIQVSATGLLGVRFAHRNQCPHDWKEGSNPETGKAYYYDPISFARIDALESVLNEQPRAGLLEVEKVTTSQALLEGEVIVAVRECTDFESPSKITRKKDWESFPTTQELLARIRAIKSDDNVSKMKLRVKTSKGGCTGYFSREPSEIHSRLLERIHHECEAPELWKQLVFFRGKTRRCRMCHSQSFSAKRRLIERFIRESERCIRS